MSTITAVLRKKPNKQGLYPICVRIIKNRKSTFIYTKQYIELKYWDKQNRRVKKSHPNSTRLNNLISKKISEANEVVLEDEIQHSNLSSKQIHTKVKRKGKSVSFFQLASERIKNKYLKGAFSVAKESYLFFIIFKSM